MVRGLHIFFSISEFHVERGKFYGFGVKCSNNDPKVSIMLRLSRNITDHNSGKGRKTEEGAGGGGGGGGCSYEN